VNKRLRLTIKINEFVFKDCGVNDVRSTPDFVVSLAISILDVKTEISLEFSKGATNEERSIGISDTSKQCLEIKLLVLTIASRFFVTGFSSKVIEFFVDLTLI
jgi:hypothetical protein